MELTNTLQLVSTADLTQQITEMCQTHLPGPYDPKHLPKDLRDEQDAYERQMQYYLGQALSLYQRGPARKQRPTQARQERRRFAKPWPRTQQHTWPGITLAPICWTSVGQDSI